VRAAEVPRVEAIIAEAMNEYRTWLHELAAVPSIQRLLALSRAICDEEIERIRRTGLATGPEALDLVGNRLVNALMRTIIDELKETARSASEAHGSGDLTRLGRGLGKDQPPMDADAHR
jgi:glutamyl-tRNA reductase